MSKLNFGIKHNKYFRYSIISLVSFVAIFLVCASIYAIAPKKASADTIAELKAQVTAAEQMYVQANIEKSQAEQRYQECQETIEYASWKQPQLQGELSKSVATMYRNGIGVNSLVQCIVDSTDLGDLLSRLDYINAVHNKYVELMNECADLKASAEQAQADIWPSLQTADEKAAEAQSIMASAQGAIEALEAQNIPVIDPGTGGGGGGGGGGDDPGPGPGPSPDPGPIPYGDDVVSRALACLGKPYGWGCAGPDAFDCSGLVSFAYTGEFVHYWSTYSIRTESGEGICGWWRTDSPSNGTCCCSMGHCGIYYNGQMIHAPEPGDVVKIGPIQGDMLFYNR